LRLIIIGFDTPPMKVATRTTTSSPLPTLPVTPATQAKAGALARAIAIAVCLGWSRWSHCHPCRWQWHQAPPPPPWPCCPRPCPPHCQSPLLKFSGHRSPQNGRAQVRPAGHLCCGHTSSANHGSCSALALLCSAPAHCHCSHYCSGRCGAWAMPPPWQACAGRWSSWPS
jgi:hypothetical protein